MPELQQLLDAGGWVVCVGVLIGLLNAFRTGALVSGPTHKREIERGDRAEKAAEAAARANVRLLGRISELERTHRAADR